MKTKLFAVSAAALLLAGCAAQPAAPTAQTESADPLTLTFFNIDGASDPWTDPVALKITEATGVSRKTEYPARGSDDAIGFNAGGRRLPRFDLRQRKVQPFDRSRCAD